MSSVPFTFANNTGNIPLNQLDTNFANCKAFANTAGFVTANAQANITSLGTLTSLSVSGNVTVSEATVVANNVSANRIAGTLTTNAQPNVTSLGTLTSVSVAGNVTSGNLVTVGATVNGNLIVQGNALIQGNTTIIDSTTLNVTDKTITVANGAVTTAQIDGAGIDAGNPTLAYIRYSDSGSAWTTASNFFAGNVIGANTIAGNSMNLNGEISTTGNVLADQIQVVTVSASGNVTGANILTGGRISATGNIVAGNLSVSGTTTLTGIPTAPTAANGTSNTQVATTAFVSAAVINGIPTGVIVMWSGAIVNIPAGWFLCNGANGTPDLRDRFIVGAGGAYAVAATGGSADAVVVSHTHAATVTDPGHTHTFTASVTNFTSPTGSPICGNQVQLSTTNSSTTGISVTNASAGVSGTNANLPPYYALAYIMKG